MFIREVLFLFILCGLFFIILFLLYMRIREIRKENEILREIIERYISRAKKAEQKEEGSGENPLCINSGDTNSITKTEFDSDTNTDIDSD